MAIIVLLAVPAVALSHGQENPLDLQAAAFASVAQNAAANSNAPRSFAPCVQGYAGEFPCHNVDLLSFVPSADLGVTFVNDIWGWTDPETGSDYALVGSAEGLVGCQPALMADTRPGLLAARRRVGRVFLRC